MSFKIKNSNSELKQNQYLITKFTDEDDFSSLQLGIGELLVFALEVFLQWQLGDEFALAGAVLAGMRVRPLLVILQNLKIKIISCFRGSYIDSKGGHTHKIVVYLVVEALR